MVAHPSEYPWSSYRANAVGVDNLVITPHWLYEALGKEDAERHAAYRDLFKAQLNETTLSQIREATNKAWVLGSDYFKEKIAKQLNRRVDKAPKGGDRKSEAYRKSSRPTSS